ncbi:MAG: glycosyltransferase family 4 protein [Candidatus Nanopusillus acidilobi]
MRIAVLLDPRWGGGIKTFCTGALFSFLKLKELYKLSLGDVKIDFYVMTPDPNDNVEYFKVDFNELYELYKNKDIKKIIELANKENYASISQKISLDDILEGLSNSDFIFITNVGFAVYNKSLKKEDLDKILSNNGKRTYMIMFHADYAGSFLYDLVIFINSGKLESISETTKNKIYSLLSKKIKQGYMTDEDQKNLIDIIEYLSNSNTEEAIEFRNKYGWWLDEVRGFIYTFRKLTELKNVINLFPTYIVSDSNSRFIKNVIGSNVEKREILHEPMFMITLDKYYRDEIEGYKNAYLKIYKDNKINLLYVGRRAEEKGIDDIIKLFEDLVKEGEDVRLIIVSPEFGEDTEEYKKLEEIINKYGIGEVDIYSNALGNSLHEYPLYYIGLLKALGELKSTIFINPAYTESYGLSTLEALIFGKLLTIYRDVDGLSELKDEGYLNYQTAFRTYEDLVNLTKKIIEEIKNGNYNEYVNKKAIEILEKEVDPEELAEKYAEIIYLVKEYEKIIHNESEPEYNNNLEAQSEEIEAVA